MTLRNVRKCYDQLSYQGNSYSYSRWRIIGGGKQKYSGKRLTRPQNIVW